MSCGFDSDWWGSGCGRLFGGMLVLLSRLLISTGLTIASCQLCCIQKWCADACYIILLLIIQTWKEVTGFSEAVLVVIVNPDGWSDGTIAECGGIRHRRTPRNVWTAGSSGSRPGRILLYLFVYIYFCATLALLVGVTLMSENITQLQSTLI